MAKVEHLSTSGWKPGDVNQGWVIHGPGKDYRWVKLVAVVFGSGTLTLLSPYDKFKCHCATMPRKGYKQSWKQNPGNAYSFAWQSGHTATLLLIKLYINLHITIPHYLLSYLLTSHCIFISYIRTSIFPSTPITPWYSHLIGGLEHEVYDFPTNFWEMSSSQLTNSLHHFSEGSGRLAPTNQIIVINHH